MHPLWKASRALSRLWRRPGATHNGIPRPPADCPGRRTLRRPAASQRRSSNVKFGFLLPTCMEGLNQPPASIRPADVMRIAREAEALGLDSLWANDHLAPWPKLRQQDPRPYHWYEILVTTAWCASVTTRIKLGTRGDRRALPGPHAARQAARDARHPERRPGLVRGRHRDSAGRVRDPPAAEEESQPRGDAG